MGARLFLLCERLRKGSRLLCRSRFQCRAAAASFTTALSVSSGQGISGRWAASRLPARIQHAPTFGPPASELELSLSASEVRRVHFSESQSHCTSCHDLSCALFAIASHKINSSWPV